MEQTVQEVAGTGLSSDTIATLLGVAIGGFFAIGAAFAGQVAAYMLRRRGKVLCFVPPWTERRMRGNTVRYDLTLEFYNDRDVSIGITDIIFTHYKGDGSGEGWLSLMEDKETGEIVGTLDLPPHEWVRKEVFMLVELEDEFLNRSEEDTSYQTIAWKYPFGDEGEQKIPNHPQFDHYTGTEPTPSPYRRFLNRFLRR